jgi:hypothetical protein
MGEGEADCKTTQVAPSRNSTAPWQRLIYHPEPLPISAAFAMRYLHDLVRRWAAPERRTGGCLEIGTRAVEW